MLFWIPKKEAKFEVSYEIIASFNSFSIARFN